MNADGTGAQRLTFNSTGISDTPPDWSYDGTKIAHPQLPRVGDERRRLESDQTRLTNDPGADCHPSWSPDGTRIA
jgi:hypothetical protein